MNKPIDPNEITVTPGGAIYYKGKDIRETMGLSVGRSMSTNMACLNSESCLSVNIGCDNRDGARDGINTGFCSQ